MAYATVDDFIAARGESEAIQLSKLDDANDFAINRDVIQKALDDASAEIDGYLAVRYEVPVPFGVPLLKKAAIIIARKDLDRYDRPEHVQKDYDDLVALLLRVSQGKQILVGDNGQPLPAPDSGSTGSVGRVGYKPGYRTFTYESLSGYGRL